MNDKNFQRFHVVSKFASCMSAKVAIPYLAEDDNGEIVRCWAKLDFKRDDGKLNPRQVKRGIRKWIKQTLGRSLDPIEQYNLMKRVEYCVV